MPTTKNDKQNPINGATNWQPVTNELHTIELQTDKGIYGFYLKQYPESVGTTTLNDISTGVPTGTTLTLGLSGVPQPGIVRADFTNKTGWIWCHEDDAGKTISCDYNGGGYVGHEENLDEIVTDIATPVAEAAAEAIVDAAIDEAIGDKPTNIRTRGRVPSNAADTDHDITFSAGHFYGSDGVGYEVSAITKQIDAAWAEGTNAGGIDTGAVANNTWYYAHEIRQDSSGDMDIIFSTASTSGGVNMPSGWTHKRVMDEWLFRTDGSANFRGMIYHNDGWMEWKTPPQLDFDTSTLSTTRTNATILAPSGRWAIQGNAVVNHASALRQVYISNPDLTDLAPSGSAVPLGPLRSGTDGSGRFGNYTGFTDGSSQISVVSDGGSTIFRFTTTSLKRS